MGIADRAYMRGRAPVGERLSATTWTLLILVGVFVLQVLVRCTPITDFLDWAVLKENSPQPWSWLTYALLHGGAPKSTPLDSVFFHLLGNCLVLWWTGDIVERTYGGKVFLGVIIGGILSGSLCWYLAGLGGDRTESIVGISAGVYALMLVALLDKLEHRITLLLFFFLPVSLKVRWLLIITALLTLAGLLFSELPTRQHWSFWQDDWHTTIAHSAHLGGLIFGWFAFRWLNQTNLTVQSAQEEMAPPPPRAPEPDLSRAEEAETVAVTPLTRQQARAELDTLLDKISAQGFGSLTAAEKRRLEELSARLR